MKYLVSLKGLFICFFVLAICACEKEKDDPGKLLIGTWNLMSTHIIFYYDNVKINETNNTYVAGENTLEISADGKAVRYRNGTIADSFYWVLDGNLMIITSGSGIVQKAEYAVDGITFTLKWAVSETIEGHTSRSDNESIYKRD